MVGRGEPRSRGRRQVPLHSRRLELGRKAQVENGRKGIVGMQVCVCGWGGWGVTEHSINTIGKKAEHTRHAKS